MLSSPNSAAKPMPSDKNLASMARALCGEMASRARLQIVCPGPGHSLRDRSLSVFLDPNSPDGFRVHSHAMPRDDWRRCRDYVRDRLGLPTPRFFSTSSTSAQSASIRNAEAPASGCTRITRDRPSDAKRIMQSLAIWDEAGELGDTPGATYLFRRGADLSALPPELSRVLRWHPACPWKQARHPCMLALFTDAVTGEPKGIHRTAIMANGEKVDRRTLGPIAGCIIRLWPDDDVGLGLVIGEGIETTLVAATRIAHRGTLLQPAWAAGFAGNLAKLPVLGGIEALTLLVDHDVNGAGQCAAEECTLRWTAAGREVTRLVPRVAGTDFNNIVEMR